MPQHPNVRYQGCDNNKLHCLIAQESHSDGLIITPMTALSSLPGVFPLTIDVIRIVRQHITMSGVKNVPDVNRIVWALQGAKLICVSVCVCGVQIRCL